jgi:hypothetical protein
MRDESLRPNESRHDGRRSRRSAAPSPGGLGTYVGLEATDTGSGSIRWANELDHEVRVRTVVRSAGGFLADPTVVYESEYRVFPTERVRGGDANVVETGRYDVSVEVTSRGGALAGPASTTWAPVGCYHQRSIIRVTADPAVEFRQREC